MTIIAFRTAWSVVTLHNLYRIAVILKDDDYNPKIEWCVPLLWVQIAILILSFFVR